MKYRGAPNRSGSATPPNFQIVAAALTIAPSYDSEPWLTIIIRLILFEFKRISLNFDF